MFGDLSDLVPQDGFLVLRHVYDMADLPYIVWIQHVYGLGLYVSEGVQKV